MRLREIRLLVGGLLALGALLLFGSITGRAAPAEAPAVRPAAERSEGTIRVGRLTSIPYGISPELSLKARRHIVEVTGHGSCPAEGTVDIHVFVEQETSNARAMGWRRWTCPRGEDWQWTLHVPVVEPWTFTDAKADVCSIAVLRQENASVASARWCREDVILKPGGLTR
jgi:hypothetical protein